MLFLRERGNSRGSFRLLSVRFRIRSMLSIFSVRPESFKGGAENERLERPMLVN
jgi:hypothetical protein